MTDRSLNDWRCGWYKRNRGKVKNNIYIYIYIFKIYQKLQKF